MRKCGNAEKAEYKEKRIFHTLGRKNSVFLLSLNRNFVSLQRQTTKRKEKAMSTATLTNLRDYLTGTLSPANMLWLSEQLADYAKKKAAPPRRLTLKEMNALLDEAEANFAAGLGIPHEEVMREWEEEIERWEQEDLELAESRLPKQELEMAEAV